MRNPFRYFNSSPEVIRLVVMMYIRYPLSLRQVEDILFERGMDICHETVRFRLNRFGPMFAAAIRKRRIHRRSFSQWRWLLDEVFVRINGWHCQSRRSRASRLRIEIDGIVGITGRQLAPARISRRTLGRDRGANAQSSIER
jgi:hypothetical protein